MIKRKQRSGGSWPSHYSTEQLMDAVFMVGQCNLVSGSLNSFGGPLDDFLPGAKK
jgi:hypothetical protein